VRHFRLAALAGRCSPKTFKFSPESVSVKVAGSRTSKQEGAPVTKTFNFHTFILPIGGEHESERESVHWKAP
jgi:hypothetical protein